MDGVLIKSWFLLAYIHTSLAVNAENMLAPIGLKEILSEAQSRSELLIAQDAKAKEAASTAKQAAAWQNPQLSVSAGPKWDEQAIGPFVGVSLSQGFFWPGKQRLRSEAAEYDRRSAENQTREVQLKVAAETVRLSYSYAMTKQKKEFAKKRQRRFELIESYIKGHTFAAPQKKAEKEIVERRLKNLFAEQIEISGQVTGYLEQLRLYVPLRNEPDILVPWLDGKRQIDFEDWIQKAHAQNPNLAGQQILLDGAKKQTELGQKEAWPDFSLTAFYNHERASTVEHIFGLGLSISVPSWNLNKAGIDAIQKKQTALNHLARYQQQTLASQLNETIAHVRASAQIVQSYPQASLQVMVQKLDATEAEFKKGRVDFLTFLELEKEISETYYRSLDAQLALAEHASFLLALSGESEFFDELKQF